MTSFRRQYGVYTTSHRLGMDVERTLSVKGDATLQNNKLCQKYFLGFSAMVPNNYDVEKVLENTYFVFYILYNAFQRLLLVDTTNKKVYGKFPF